jgi:hypothetical protein
MVSSLLLIIWGVLSAVCSAGVLTDLATFTPGVDGVRLIGQAGESLAKSMAYAGDFNKDGIQDFIVGIPNYKKDIYANAGLALVILGGKFRSKTEIDTATFTSGRRGMRILGRSPTGYDWMNLGRVVSAAGDVNSDGYADVLIGAAGQANFNGVIYVIFGKAGPYTDLFVETMTAGALGFTILGKYNAYQDFPSTFYDIRGALGDINGDGHDDIMVHSFDYGQPEVCIIFGKASTAKVVDVDLSNLGSAGIMIKGTRCCYQLGFSVAKVGDVNGDGRNDILIGAPGYNSKAGAVYLFYGSRTMAGMVISQFYTGRMGILFVGGSAEAELGHSTTGLGDINGDGLADFAMGSPGASPLARTFAGAVYVIFGSRKVRSADVNVSSITAGPTGYAIYGSSFSYLGTSLSRAGDQNQDGIPDILIGAINPGRVHIVYGTATTASTYVDIVTARMYSFEYSDGWLLYSIPDGGLDFNGDGFPDLLIGDYLSTVTPAEGGAARSNAGVGFAVFGPYIPTFPTTAPTEAPSVEPTVAPTGPSFEPTCAPTGEPTAEPTKKPSARPSAAPTARPTAPTVMPTASPTDEAQKDYVVTLLIDQV